jgi:transcription antitermination factor NusG
MQIDEKKIYVFASFLKSERKRSNMILSETNHTDEGNYFFAIVIDTDVSSDVKKRKKQALWYLSDGLAEPYKNRIISL